MKQHETAMKQHETAWNSAVKHHEPKINIKTIDISVVTVPDSRCFIGMTMKQTISSWFKVFHDHETVFHPDSRCFMIMFHPDSTCFTVFHDHETNCFIANSSWFNMFHHCFIALIHPVSCWFDLFHHCFITVSSLFHQWERALRRWGDTLFFN